MPNIFLMICFEKKNFKYKYKIFKISIEGRQFAMRSKS